MLTNSESTNTISLDTLHEPTLQIIFSYLSATDLAHLVLNRSLKDKVYSSEAWYSFKLKRLEAIDKPMVDSLTPDKSGQMKEHFIASFNAINTRQLQEFLFLDPVISNDHLLSFPANLKSPSSPNTYIPAQTIETLQVRHKSLDSINAELIRRQIHSRFTYPSLDISKKGLTRFPQQLFEDGDLQDYWKRLRWLDCKDNWIYRLPELGICVELESLHCNGNPIETIPESIGKCAKLNLLYCNGCLITVLPDTIGNCLALRILDCSHNQLTALPGPIGQCKALDILDFNSNHIESLPATLADCTSLKIIKSEHNPLKSLPDTIVQKYGLTRCIIIFGAECFVNMRQSSTDSEPSADNQANETLNDDDHPKSPERKRLRR